MAGKRSALESLALIGQIGISMVLPIMMGVYIGKWMDEKIGTTPIFLFTFIIIGIGSAFLTLFSMVGRDVKSKKRK